MTHSDLQTCPFCGGKAKVNQLRRGNYRREGDNYQVVCNKCRARGPLVQERPEAAVVGWNECDSYRRGVQDAAAIADVHDVRGDTGAGIRRALMGLR